MATMIMSMVTSSSDLEGQMSGANLQKEGHSDVLSQSQKDPEEMGSLGSSPPTCHLGPQPGGHCPAILILGTA